MTFFNASHGLPSTGQWRQGIAIADLNKDGYLDILSTAPRAAAQDESVPHVWYGDGKGRWTRADLAFPEGLAYDYGSVAVADFDGDGTMDVGLAMHAMALRALKGKGGGLFEDASTGFPSEHEFVSRTLIAGQFDTDPHSELVALAEGPFTGLRPSGMRLCKLTLEGQWSCRQIGDKETVAELGGDQLAAGDVNGDGFLDVASGSMNAWKRLIVWINDGKGNFAPFNQGLPEKWMFFSVALADINRDGRDDLVAAVSGIGRKGKAGIKVFLSRPEGWEEYSTGLPDEAFLRVDACDLDHDGSIDIVGGTRDGVRVFSMGPTGWQEIAVSGLAQEGLEQIYGIHCVDVNADGYGDIVVNYADDKTNHGGIQVFLNQQKATGKQAHQ